MDQAWWGMVAVVVVGAAVVFVGWSRDRRHNARAAELAAEPPRPLPGVGNGDGDKPQYVQEADLAGVTPPRPAATVADPSDGESNAAGGAGGPGADLDAVLDRRLQNPSLVIGVLAAHASRSRGWSSLAPADVAWPRHPINWDHTV